MHHFRAQPFDLTLLNLVVACAMFQNSNSLPIALMQSLIGEKMPLSWGPHDTRDSQLGRALSYLVLFSTLGIIVRWSIGVRLLTSAEAVGTEDEEDELVRQNGGDYDHDLEARNHDQGPFSDEHEAQSQPLLGQNGAHIAHGNASSTDTRHGNGVENGIEGDGARARRGQDYGSSVTTDTTSTVYNSMDTSNGSASKLVRIGPDGQDRDATKGDQQKPRGKRNKDRVFQSFPNTPIPSQYGGSQPGSSGDDDDDDVDSEWGAERGSGRRHLLSENGPWRRRMRKVARPFKKVGKAIGAFVSCRTSTPVLKGLELTPVTAVTR